MPKGLKITLDILLIIGITALGGYIIGSVLMPRIMLFTFVKNGITDVGESAAVFTEYDTVADYETITINNGHLAFDIPADYIKSETEIIGNELYSKEDAKYSVIIVKPQDMSIISILSDDNLSKVKELKRFNININDGLEELVRGFEKMGNGKPDTAYSAYKCIYMLDEDDYSFWDLEQARAYAVGGVIKQIIPSYGDHYLYEREEICGFMQIEYNSISLLGPKYTAFLELYSTDDYNTVTTLTVTAETIEEIYAIANSARKAD